MQTSFSTLNTNYAQLTQFKINKRLGYSKYPVYHLQVMPHGAEYAIKVFPDTEAAFEAYSREKEILSNISHPNIVQCIPDVYFNNINSVHCHCILLEYTPYEDFFTLVKKKGLTNEKLIRTYFHQLIEGIEYLHSQGIAHLDLKLENILLGRNFQLIIADFDQSQSINEKQLLASGTSCYRSPEILERKCQDFFAADVYALGIILFLFKTREFPFIERNKGGAYEVLDYNLFQQNNKSFWEKKSIGKKEQPFFSESFKELINGMLEADPVKRWTIQDIKCSNWYNEPILEYQAFATRMEKVVERIFSKEFMKVV